MAIGKRNNLENSYEINKPKGVKYVWYILLVIESLILTRLVFRLFGLEAGGGIVTFIYGLTDWLTRSFNDVFGTTHFAGIIIEWYVLFAMFSYWIIAWAIARFFFLEKQK